MPIRKVSTILCCSYQKGTIWRAEEIRGKRIPEGPDGPAAGHGGKRSGPQGGLCRGPAKGGILPDGAWKEPEAHFGFHVGLG